MAEGIPRGVTRARKPRAGANGRIVFGDSREVLAALGPSLERQVRFAYLDPPFNTGRRFDEYVDRAPKSVWRSSLAATVERVAPLLDSTGSVALHIGDRELSGSIDILDDAFGSRQRISIVTVVRSASTGHKAINAGPVNVSDYVLLYAKDKKAYAPQRLFRPRDGRDTAYGSIIVNFRDPPAKWRLESLKSYVAKSLGHDTTRRATRALGEAAFEAETTRIALAEAHRVVRKAQPRIEAIGQRAQRAVVESRAKPDQVIVLRRAKHSPFYLLGGDRLLFLADKVQAGQGGEPTVVEPLTNVWSDIPFQGIAREGGVRFVRNKKPERLIERLLLLSTAPGDLVLDPYLGSGTTAAVAHKMGRRWIGIERESVNVDKANERLARVVRGMDATGISKRYAWKGGGSFVVERAKSMR